MKESSGDFSERGGDVIVMNCIGGGMGAVPSSKSPEQHTGRAG
jgi:hypothetical protein